MKDYNTIKELFNFTYGWDISHLNNNINKDVAFDYIVDTDFMNDIVIGYDVDINIYYTIFDELYEEYNKDK